MEEQKENEIEGSHLYTIVKVARAEDFRQQIGKDFYFDLVDHNKVRRFCIKKEMPFNLFKMEVAKELGVPEKLQRFWLWAKRQNHTYRPHRPLTLEEETQFVGQLREVSNKAHNAELKLFLEIELGPELHPIPPPNRAKEDILLFFKLYDAEKEEIWYVGRLFVKGSGKPSEILKKLNEMAGFSPNEEIELYEEIKFAPTVMCEHIDKKLTFRASQLEDGDIIFFQKSALADSMTLCRYADVPSFLEYVHNRQVVYFRSLEKPKEDDFCLELSKKLTYDDVTKRVARHLGLDDPAKIRLTPHNCFSQQPKSQPIKYQGVDHLSEMLIHHNQTSDILYYEVLDIPLPELQGSKTLKVAFHNATRDDTIVHSIRLPKQSTVGILINYLKTKVELSHPDAELRLLEVFYHKIYKIFPLNEKIENINDQYWTLRAEEIPEEEKYLGPQDCLIHVYHFTKDASQTLMQVQNFGEPFFLLIRDGETLGAVKLRIQKKLQVPDKEFTKWKFAFCSLGRPEYLQDSDILFSRFQRRDTYGAWEQYLGLEHSDRSWKRGYPTNQQFEESTGNIHQKRSKVTLPNEVACHAASSTATPGSNPRSSSSAEKDVSSNPSIQGVHASMFGKSIELAKLVGCGDHVLVYNFWVPPRYAVMYKDIVEQHGHIPSLERLKEMNCLVSITRSLLAAFVGMTNAEETAPSAEDLRDWGELLDAVKHLNFNISWMEEIFKGLKAKYDARVLLCGVIAKLKEELVLLQAEAKEKQVAQQKLVMELAIASTSVSLSADAVASKEKQIREKEAELNAAL